MRGVVGIVVVATAVLAGCLSGGGADPLLVDDLSDEAPAPISLPYLAPGSDLSLALDVPVSWVGPFITSSLELPPACASPLGSGCLDYPVTVPEGAAELRVALDHPDAADVFFLDLIDPSGNVREGPQAPYSVETRVDEPSAGSWTVRVVPQRVNDSPFRVRVAALANVTDDRPSGTWLPNARPLAPWDFRFEMPVVPLGGIAPSVPAGASPTSCFWEEWALNGYAARCLRFSFGWGNDGLGAFEARIGEPPAGSLTAPVTQRVYASGGSFEEFAAGTATVHKAHGHYHLDGAFHVEAFRVADGEPVSAGVSAKRGSCTLDYLLLNWTSWDQDEQDSSGSNCGSAVPQTTVNPRVDMMAITRGWADVYMWDLADNYIDFTGQPDGEYVLRARVDAAAVFLESHEDDNVAYAHIVVHGAGVQVLERGYGLDPWDPHKQVIAEPWVT